MSRFHGRAFRGAKKALREGKRADAERRNAVTPPERRSTKRQHRAERM